MKEGTNRDLGHNKIATITEKLTSKIPEAPEPVIPKSVRNIFLLLMSFQKIISNTNVLIWFLSTGG